MENGGGGGGELMFSDEELREISGVKRGGDYVEVTCGCTSHRYGDAVGRLRVSLVVILKSPVNAPLVVRKEFIAATKRIMWIDESLCKMFRFSVTQFMWYGLDSPMACVLIKGPSFEPLWNGYAHTLIVDAIVRCLAFTNQMGFVYDLMSCFFLISQDKSNKLTPAAFEKHSGRETARKWKNNVWVIVNGEKVPLSKTVLLKYYNQASKNANGSHRSHNGRVCHRDEFVRCTRCNKERRFRLRSKEECRIHHDALADVNWKCPDLPYDKLCY
ncbi:Protein ULTRAPETALA 1 [Vitis vinifera]|uniref:Protein ULTRAPETALA 1 n=1 Tax=Vitis vinifera TaxID=29760 RepID=A0A438JI12_VITVI|nr:Protein ULTRAPETALA 1 [Vitis vinifera]